MWVFLQWLIAMFVGGIITWWVAQRVYKNQAADDRRTRLRDSALRLQFAARVASAAADSYLRGHWPDPFDKKRVEAEFESAEREFWRERIVTATRAREAGDDLTAQLRSIDAAHHPFQSGREFMVIDDTLDVVNRWLRDNGVVYEEPIEYEPMPLGSGQQEVYEAARHALAEHGRGVSVDEVHTALRSNYDKQYVVEALRSMNGDWIELNRSDDDALVVVRDRWRSESYNATPQAAD